ncbi:ATP-binding protein [Thermoproteota archaeon]
MIKKNQLEAVRNYMTKKVVVISSNSSLLDTIKLMRKKNIGSLLVAKNRQIVGIFTERDLLNRPDWKIVDKIHSLKVSEIMTKDLRTVPEAQSYTSVLELMQRHSIRHMPVTKNGRIIGIVSLRDLLNSYQDHLQHLLELKEVQLFKNMQEIKESEERFRMIFNNSAVGITLTDKKEHIVAWNPFAAQLLGMDDSDLRNRLVKDLYPPQEWSRIRAHKIRRLGIKHHFETKMLTKQSDIIDVDVSISVIKDGKGSVQGSIGIIRDITERKKLEKIRGEFVGVVSHELRGPLVPIREAVSQVLDGILGKTTKVQREFLSIALSEIDRLKRIINNLLDMFRLEAGSVSIKPQLCDLEDLVGGVISAFSISAKDKGVALESHFPKKSAKAFIDRDKIARVFTNLVGNALKFTQKGKVVISVVPKKKTIECSVSDTGKGVKKEDLSKLFQKFQQVDKDAATRKLGTGLGLVICKDIIELHKGEIWVESRLNKGTKFTFTLPILTPKEVFKQHVIRGINLVLEGRECFAALVFTIEASNVIEEKAGKAKIKDALHALESIVNDNLRRSKDMVVKYEDSILVMLPATAKETTVTIIERIQEAFDEFILKEKLHSIIHITKKIVTFPDDGNTAGELFKKLGVS